MPEKYQKEATTTPSPRSTLEKVSIKGINVEELIEKGLKRINDLIDKPFNRKSEEELEKRLSEVNVSVIKLSSFFFLV